MAGVSSTQALLSRTGDVETGIIQGQNIQVEQVGSHVYLDQYMYSSTNFLIAQSRKYVGKRKLTKYFYIKWLHWLCIPIFLGSFFTAFHYIASFVMFGVNLLIFVIYTQHMYVNITTMWYVLKQPSVPDNVLRTNNALLELQLDNYQARYARSYRAGIGFIARSRQTAEFQVFRKSAVKTMKNCVITSTLCFIGSLFMFLYCYVWGIFLVLQGITPSCGC